MCKHHDKIANIPDWKAHILKENEKVVVRCPRNSFNKIINNKLPLISVVIFSLLYNNSCQAITGPKEQVDLNWF